MNKNTGFTLVEVLVTVVVMAIGLLGLAGLQANSLKHNQTAYFRSQATQLTYDMADRMRANKIEASKGATSVYITTLPSNANVQTSCTAIAGACSPATMAENDLFEWLGTLRTTLPGNNAIGTITFNDPFFNIIIQWDDNRDDQISSSDPSFLTDFQL